MYFFSFFQDFTQQNKFAGLLADDEDAEDEDESV